MSAGATHRRGRQVRAGAALVAALALGAALGAGARPAAGGEVIEVSGTSMEPTLSPGERLVVDRNVRIRRGDIVVFERPMDWTGQPVGDLLVKRVVAIGGDRVSCCTDRGHILVNDVPVAEPYLAEAAADPELGYSHVLAAGTYWVLGDDRARSVDSRAFPGGVHHGAVRAADVVGVVRLGERGDDVGG